MLWRREWQPTPVFLPGESHGQRSLGRYSPWGCKEPDTTKRLTLLLLLLLGSLGPLPVLGEASRRRGLMQAQLGGCLGWGEL